MLSGYIISCGDGVHIFDAEIAELLHDLRVPLESDSLQPPTEDHQRQSFTCLSYSSSVIAAGLKHIRHLARPLLLLITSHSLFLHVILIRTCSTNVSIA
jgi:hypothetical protein